MEFVTNSDERGVHMRVLLFIAMAGLLLHGCGGENADVSDTDSGNGMGDEIAEENVIVGTWEVIDVISGEDISNTGVIYVFNEDGTMESSSGALKIEGTWSISGDTLKQVLGGIDMDVLFSFDGDDLVYDIINGEQTFLLELK